MSAAGMAWAFEQYAVRGNDLLTLVVIADGADTFAAIQRQTHAASGDTRESLRGLLDGGYIAEAAPGRYELTGPPAARNPEVSPTVRRRPIGTRKALAVFERDGFRCRHCGASQGLTVDHVKPVAHGGGNDMENLQTLCGPCNSSKGTRQAPARAGQEETV